MSHAPTDDGDALTGLELLARARTAYDGLGAQLASVRAPQQRQEAQEQVPALAELTRALDVRLAGDA